MKKIILFAFILSFVVACDSNPTDISKIDLDDFKQRISYALGADMGANLANLPEELFSQLNKREMEAGFYEYLKSKDLESEDCLTILENSISFQTGNVDTTEYSIDEISNCYGALFGEMMRKSLDSKNAWDEVNLNIIKMGFYSALTESDTLIELEERHKMIIDFNNDLNKLAGEEFLKKKMKEFPNNVADEEYVLVEHSAGTGETIDLSNEFDILYTITTITGDTVISTIQDPSLPDEENTYTINSEDVVFTEGWKLASKNMKVGGSYTVYHGYELGFGEEGLPSPNTRSYVIQPFSAIVIHSKIFSQGERFAGVKKKGKEVIEAAKKNPKAVVDPSGFVLITIKEGTGKRVPEGGDVQAHYILTNSEGDVIENSYLGAARGGEIPSFSLNGVVRGWQLAIPKMREGGEYELVLPYDLAYGEAGNQGIQPYETLTFKIEIVKAGEPGELVQVGPQQQLTEEQLQQLQEQLQMQMGQ